MPEQAALELQKFATEVRKLAYEIPAEGEYALLQLSQRMHAEADRWLRRSPMARTQFPEQTQPTWD